MSTDKFLPFAKPFIESEEIDAAVKTLRSGWLTQGPRVLEFEKSFSNYLGGNTSIAVNSATAALHLALISLGIGPGDEVITTPFTFASTANVIELVGATTVFADVEEATLNIDADDVAKRVTSRTKAILPVHFAGFPCDLDRLCGVANENGLVLIEDAAHALGATYRGEKIGRTSEFAAFSFYPIKNMTAVEGGMLVTSRADLVPRLKMLRWYGLSEGVWERFENASDMFSEVIEPGFKYNMNDLQAAVGLVQLGRLDDLNRKRRILAERYTALLQDIEEIILPNVADDVRESSCHVFAIRVDPRSALSRKAVVTELRKRNIGTSYHYRSLHLHPHYSQKYASAGKTLPIATRASEQVISLPLFPQMDVRDVERVADGMREIFSRC